MTAVDRALVVGHGYAGRRFVAAIRYLASIGVPVELVGVCDRSAAQLSGTVAGYTDLSEALAALRPSVVCVTVNEADHMDVYRLLGGYERALVISEKPLTASLRDLDQATAMLRHHAFAMNLVERFSPVVRDYRAWARRTGRLTVMRVESFWGKHRIADPRPTIGVLSELIHPVDLIRYLFPDNDLRILGGHGVESDFSPHSASILDSLDLHATMGDAPVLLHSSYAWPTRQRTISALLWSPTEGMIRVELEFDTPHWDCDRLDISRIASNGRWARIHHSATDVATLPLPIQGVGKVVNFLDSSLRAARTGRADDELVDLTTAGELQKICNDIDRSIRRFDAPACYRRDAEHVEVEV